MSKEEVPKLPSPQLIEEVEDNNVGEFSDHCDVNIRYIYGYTLLHFAILKGWTAISESLIAKGADVNSPTNMRITPLQTACKRGLVDEISMLLLYGADPSIVSKHRKSALDEAARHFDKPKIQEILFDSLFVHMKTLNILTLAYAMKRGISTFPRLLENTLDIMYEYDLEEFSRMFTYFKPEWFKMFIVKFGYIIEEMFHKCNLANMFLPYRRTKREVQKFAGSLCVLFESDLVSGIVAKLNSDKCSVFFWIMYIFDDHRDLLDTLTQLICCMVSYGMDVNSSVVDTIFMNYGYCELFKTMLYMDIKRTDDPDILKSLLPHLIHDVHMTIEAYADNWKQYDPDTVYRIFDYFAYPKLGDCGANILLNLNRHHGVQILPSVPSLVELSRNSARDHIIKRFNIRNSIQFYTALERLPIDERHKKIISFETKLYPMSPSRNKSSFYENATTRLKSRKHI